MYLNELRDVVKIQQVPDAPVDAHGNGNVLSRNNKSHHWGADQLPTGEKAPEFLVLQTQRQVKYE